MRRVHRMLILLISVLVVAGLLPATAKAANTASSRFILVAESKSGLIIPPTYVYHAGGEMTMLEALANSGIRFTGLENGMVTAIEDVSGSFSRSDEDGEYSFTKLASQVTHYCFSERPSSASKPTEGLMLLMTAMADYLEEEEDVQKAAKAEYQEARKQFVGLDSDSAKTLAKSLTDAVNNYKAILGGQTYEIRFTDQSKDYSDANFPRVTITAKNAYGKQWSDPDHDGKLHLPYGSYTFCVSHDGYSVSSDIMVTEADVIDVSLPQEQRLILDSFRLSGSYGADDDESSRFKDAEFALNNWMDRSLTVSVLDSFSGAVYSYVQCDPELLNKSPKLTAVYTAKNAVSSPIEKNITFESLTSGANSVLGIGSKGNTVIYRLSWAENGYTYSQDYTVDFARVPTLASITVEDQNGTDQAASEAFDSERLAYTYKVLDTIEKVKVHAVPLVDGYEIQINGKKTEDGIAELHISDNTEIEVTVSSNGYSNTYILQIQPGSGQTLIFSSRKEITLQVVNKNGVEIPYTYQKATDYSNHYLFTLVPGEKYSYVATYDTYYHLADDFVLDEEAGSITEVDFDSVSNWLTELAIGFGGNQKMYKGNLPLVPEFSEDIHYYQTNLVDTENVAYVWATSEEDDVDIELRYNQVFNGSYHGKPNTINVYSGNNYGQQISRFLMDENPIENTVTIRISKTDDGVTYYQDYIVDFKRTLTLQSLSAKCEGATAVLQRNDGKNGFDPSIKEYSVKVSLAASSLLLDLSCYQENLCPGEESVGYSVTVEEGGTKTVLTEAGSAVIKLDGTINTQMVTITVENDKAPNGSTTYVVKILKAPPVETTFTYFPQSALLNLREVLSGERLWPDENGKFLLCEGYSYDYVLTAYGYVSKAGRLTVTQNGQDQLVILDGEREYAVSASGSGGAAEIKWNLAAAEPNEKIDPSITSPWPNFRGYSSNNAVTDKEIPTLAENGTLYWANQIGSGIDSDAVGSPILVGDDIITYASDNLFRVNTVTGEIMATGKMDHKSSFSITPPTYAEGMVFVALSNGCVQAFNAETLESLWVYNDPRGGQPNCPLTVNDGYLYTGFWNSETGNANFVCMTITDEDPTETKEEKYASWFYTAKGGFYWAGAYVNDKHVLVGTDDGTNACNSNTSRLLMLEAKTGKLLDSWDNLNGDIRSTVVYDSSTDAYYFTSKGGSFYGFRVSEQQITGKWMVGLQNGVGGTPMSTCSPVVYNGRAYVGVSGAGQFSAYSGHNITVIDLNSQSIAYSVKTQGYPQTSGLLTTAYEQETGYVYVYFFDNYTPGKLRVLRDRPGMTGPDMYTQEGSRQTAYALFTPTGDQAQYAICSPIVDEYGTIYFKNDSAHLMAFGSTIKELKVTTMPAKTQYLSGESFESAGIVVTAVYANGKERVVTDYVTYSTTPLTEENNKVTVSYSYGMYQNQENGSEMLSGITTPTVVTTLELSVQTGKLGDVDGNGIVDQADAEMILEYEAQLLDKNLNPMVADVSSDDVIDSNDAVLILQSLQPDATTE